MRCSKLFLLLPLAAAAPVAAQGFEGTVTMKMSGGGGQDMTATIAIKGDMSVTTMTMNAGGRGNVEARSILDAKANTMTMLTTMPPGAGAGLAAMNGGVEPKGIKMVMDLSKVPGGNGDAKATIKKLGTTQTIAGMSCDDYEITPEKGSVTRICVTQAMGAFVFPGSGGMGGRGQAAPAWSSALPKGSFPLKVWSTDGKVAMEVTSVSKGPVPASAFVIPDGYMDMSKMGGMMGRGRGGL